jgi:branched-chain amino acid transport system substrate-binding protein
MKLSRATVLCAGIAAAVAGMWLPGRAQVQPFEIVAVLSTTGPNAVVGAGEEKAMRIAESIVNKSGGIKGRPLKFVVLDDQSITQNTVALFTQALQRKPSVIVGPQSTTTCSATAPLLNKNGPGPVMFCLSPGIHPEMGSYAFSASVSTAAQAPALIRYFRLRGWTRLAAITATDASGLDVDQQLDAILALPENKSVSMVSHEHFSPTDINVTAQLQKVRASGAQALITWATGAPFGTLLRGITDAGLEIPVGASPGTMTYAQLTPFKSYLPKELYFPATRGFGAEPGRGPVQAAQATFFDGLKAAGLRPDISTVIAWDPLMLVVDAFRKLGTEATSEQVHTYLEGLKGWVGICGPYDFTDKDNAQRGIGAQASIVYRWDVAKDGFQVVSKPAGYLK